MPVLPTIGNSDWVYTAITPRKVKFLLARRYTSAVCAMVCVSVCLSVTSRRYIETTGWIELILAHRLSWTYLTLCYKNLVFPK